MDSTPEVTQPPAAAGTHHEAAPDAQGHHEEDPSNPHYFGLPVGVIIAAAISATAVGITLLKFFWFS
jgi:hypothetical protein